MAFSTGGMGLGVVTPDNINTPPNGSTYVPAGDCVETDGTRLIGPCPASDDEVDEGRFIRVVASYTDGEGTDEVKGVSMYAVRGEESSDSDAVENPENGSPGFTEGEDYTRSVDEDASADTNVGTVVEAMDPDDDTLSYDLWVDDDRGADDTSDPTTETEIEITVDGTHGDIQDRFGVLLCRQGLWPNYADWQAFFRSDRWSVLRRRS